MSSSAKSAGAGLFAATGLGSAFALASCCAIPFGLAAIGIGSSWLVPLVRATDPLRTALWAVAALSIALSVAFVWHAARNCAPGELCARRGFRLSIYGAALLSLGLLAAGYFYG
jgi:mercuric ion transport protein